jgi:hypothetical protein
MTKFLTTRSRTTHFSGETKMTDSLRGSVRHLKDARLVAVNAEKDGLPLEQIVDRIYDQVVGDVRVTLENYERLLEDAPIGLRPVEVSPSEFIWSEFIIGRVE